MHNQKVFRLTQSALIAAMYIALTLLSNAFGLASGPVQVRLSEILTVLPYFTPAAIPGLFVGCLLSNLLTGCVVWDVVCGSVATLLGAVGTYLLRKYKWFAPLPPILCNTLIVPFVLQYACGAEKALPFLMLTVGLGEVVSAGIPGMLLLLALERYDLFKKL